MWNRLKEWGPFALGFIFIVAAIIGTIVYEVVKFMAYWNMTTLA